MNTEIWDALKQPPQSALKQISAGRLKGKTDISPMWRMQAMTEQFGPVGIGWGYTIDELWTVPGADGQVFAFARVSVWYMHNKIKVGPIQGIGGHMLIVQESKGLYCNDEAYKMAVTDALSVALKALGVAANIYLGMNGDSKYSGTPNRTGSQENPARSTAQNGGELTGRMKAAAGKLPADRQEYWRGKYKVHHGNEAEIRSLVEEMEKEAAGGFPDEVPDDTGASKAFDGEKDLDIY